MRRGRVRGRERDTMREQTSCLNLSATSRDKYALGVDKHVSVYCSGIPPPRILNLKIDVSHEGRPLNEMHFVLL